MLPVRVLIVDDSVVVRKLLAESLASGGDVKVVGTAPSGAIALAKIPQLNPDVITLDVEMPGLNGIETLIEIRKLYPRLPVIMFSTLTEHGAAVTLEALSLGASDYMTKPTGSETLGSTMEQVRRGLVEKIVAIGRRHAAIAPPAQSRQVSLDGQFEIRHFEVLAIGASTGGPNALAEVIPQLPKDFPIPTLIVQHMPPLFTRLLAERLNAQSRIAVREAQSGHSVEAGQAWIARGDYHMTVSRKGAAVALNLNQEASENSCRPAVDVLFRSVAETYGANVLAVVMTGMGSDGARGAARIHEAGGEVLVQDQASSVVWGMPGTVVSRGLADKICPLAEIGPEIVRRVEAGRKRVGAIAAARV